MVDLLQAAVFCGLCLLMVPLQSRRWWWVLAALWLVNTAVFLARDGVIAERFHG